MEKTLTPKPKKSSEKKLSEARTMDFPEAMREIINGNSVARVSWGNKDYCLLRNGWLTVFTRNEFHTWTINDGDLLGRDWTVVGGTN